MPGFGNGNEGLAVFVFGRRVHHDERRARLPGGFPPYPEVTAEAGITGNGFRAGAVKTGKLSDPIGQLLQTGIHDFMVIPELFCCVATLAEEYKERKTDLQRCFR